jgi:membrane-associated phospholipid phosphatase
LSTECLSKIRVKKLLTKSSAERVRKFLFFLLAIISTNVHAQLADSTKNKTPLFAADSVQHLHSKAYSVIIPAAFISYGALSLAVHPIRHFDYYIRSEVRTNNSTFHTKVDNFILFAPVVMTYGLNMLGDEGKNRFGDRTALLGLSAAFMSISTFPLKHFSHRLRPDGSDKQSFPSGHTAAAFALAEFMAQEYGDKSPVYTIVGYSFATATGVLRIYNNAHWFSDVVAGAGFGILSTKAAYLVYPYLRNMFTHSDKSGKSTFFMPTYQSGVAGLAFSKTF